VGGDLLGDHRNAAGTADEDDAGEVAGGEPRRGDRPVEGGERVGHPRPHGSLELGPGHAHVGGEAREAHGDRRLGVGRQRFLGRHALGS
jgi:hypothetical protein